MRLVRAIGHKSQTSQKLEVRRPPCFHSIYPMFDFSSDEGGGPGTGRGRGRGRGRGSGRGRGRPRRKTKEEEETELKFERVASRVEREVYSEEWAGRSGDTLIYSKRYETARPLAPHGFRPFSKYFPSDAPPTLSQFCALAVIQNQEQISSLTNVPWATGGAHIVAILHAMDLRPSQPLLAALMEEYPEFRDANSTLILRGKFRTPHNPVLRRMSDPHPAALFPRFLTHLDLSFTDFSDEMARHLSSLEALTILNLAATDIGDKGLIKLLRPTAYDHSVPALRRLSHINLAETLVTPDCTPYLARVPSLRAVDLSGTDVMSVQDLRGDSWDAWISLPARMPLLQDHSVLKSEDIDAISEKSPFSSEELRERLTHAWRTKEVAQATMRNEIWFYAKDMTMGGSLMASAVDKELREQEECMTAEPFRLIKMHVERADFTVTRKLEGEHDENRIRVKKRARVASLTGNDENSDLLASSQAFSQKAPTPLDILSLDAGRYSMGSQLNAHPSPPLKQQHSSPSNIACTPFAKLVRRGNPFSSSSPPASVSRFLSGTTPARPVIARRVPQGILRLASSKK
ncbi:hypothetical protein DFJ77DRAFT_335043 [Powellomyces hirtus]|nr:hypothetical protein DFJ77DRAFT_335043 [Powellomyces hirtus]